MPITYTPTQRNAINSIISIFETGRVPNPAAYATRTSLPDGAFARQGGGGMTGIVLAFAFVAVTGGGVLGCFVNCTNTTVEEAAVCTNDCPDYSTSWSTSCPTGSRCIKIVNNCAEPITLTYNVGCNGDGTAGSPQCACTQGPTLAENGGTIYWPIVDGDYTSCTPYTPSCLTEGLSVTTKPDCSGTRVEFTAGNAANEYGRFDSYDLDIENGYSGVPVTIAPALTCANDNANGDCRSVYCGEAGCPDAYSTPISGGCPGMSPQVGCQDTFSDNVGYTVTFCAAAQAYCGSAPACP